MQSSSATEPQELSLERRFTDVLNANAAALARLAASYTRSASDRDDLLQDIAIALWQALPRFRGECSERTFLFRIAHNRCIALLARRRPLVALGEEEEASLPDPRPATEEALSQEEQSNRLLEAVRRLPVIYREVVVLMLEGMEYTEIAQVLGIGATNVGVRLNRARAMLKQLLGESR